ncbi:MAG: DinB family protein [archaeon]|nr:DinB family protein [archaeon]
MTEQTLGEIFLKELEAEESATRKCLEKIPIDKMYDWKPHEKSMKMGDLSFTIADIPRWMVFILKEGEIDFASFEQIKINTTKDLVKHFEKNCLELKKLLKKVEDEDLNEVFLLKNEGQTLDTSSKRESISSSINHLVHHRGQLSVYMRLNGIPVPSIYGPSADENPWKN